MTIGEIVMVVCTVAGILVYIGILARAFTNLVKSVRGRFHTPYDENHS